MPEPGSKVNLERAEEWAKQDSAIRLIDEGIQMD
jgi:hypothetical protein